MTENFDVDALKKGDDTATQGGDDAAAAADKAAADKAASDKAAADAAAAGGADADKIAADKAAADKAAADKATADKAAADKAAAAAQAGMTDEEKKAAADKATADKAAADKAAADAAAAGKPAPTTEELKRQATEELLKEAGVTSLAELKEKLKPKVELTEDQKREAAEKYEVNVDKYAVDNKVMTLGEIQALNNAMKATDEQLAFAQYEKNFKEAKKDATPEEIQQAFKLFYHVDATDEALKTNGAAAMKERADAMRNQLAAKRNMAKEAFDDHSMRSSKIPGYKQTIQSALNAYVPEQIELIAGEGEDKVVFKIDPKQKAELEKLLVGEETFEAFLKDGDSQQVRNLLKDKIDGLLLLKNRALIIKTAYDAGLAKGRQTGSSTGATNSFAMNNNGGAAVVVDGDDTNLNQQERDKLGTLFGGHN